MGQTGSSIDILIWMASAAALFFFFQLMRPAINRRRWPGALDLSSEAMMMSLLSIGVLFLLLQGRVEFIVPIVIAIMVHEYGHVLAYRLTGHRNPRYRLVPFGGVAYSQQHHGSQRDAFFVAIMGPGFSLVLTVLLLLASNLTANYFFLINGWPISPAPILQQIALWIGLLNAINLLPIYPLDGGKALQSIASVAGPRRMRSIMMTATLITAVVVGVVAIGRGMWILLFIAIFGLIQAETAIRSAQALPSMRRRDAILCGMVYVATIAALAYPARYQLYIELLVAAQTVRSALGLL